MNPLIKTLGAAAVAGVACLGVTACSRDLPTGPVDRAGGDPANVVRTVPAASNDDFNNAVRISRLPFTQNVSTTNATTAADDPVPGCADGGRGPTVWYIFTTARATMVEAVTTGSNYDTDVVLYTGTRGNLTELACNDDADGTVQSRVKFYAEPGQTYFIMVGAWASGPGGNLVFTLRKPSAEVFRSEFFHDGTFVHIIPEHNVTFTIGLIPPIADLAECGGSNEVFLSDVRATSQVVETPVGALKLLDKVEGTFVLYNVSLLSFDDFCDLAPYEIARGRGTFTRTDNSLTGVGPGINAFGFRAQADLILAAGGPARFTALMRWLWDGVEVTTLVDKFELK